VQIGAAQNGRGCEALPHKSKHFSPKWQHATCKVLQPFFVARKKNPCHHPLKSIQHLCFALSGLGTCGHVFHNLRAQKTKNGNYLRFPMVFKGRSV